MAYGTPLQQALYYRAPGWARDLGTTAYGCREAARRYGRDFQHHLSVLRQAQAWPEAQTAARAEQLLWAFLEDAVGNTPFYRKDPAYQKALGARDLSAFPLLEKARVRGNEPLLCRDGWEQAPHRIFRTSGSTGTPMRFPIVRSCFQREYAFRELHYNWGGVSLVGGDRFAFCAGHPVAAPDQQQPPFWALDRRHHHLYLSSYHLTGENLPRYLDRLSSFRPDVLAGYPSSVYLLALAQARRGDNRIRPRAVYTFSETLLESQRAMIEQAFRTRVFNWYGNSEMCANIVACTHGLLHIQPLHSRVEVLDDHDRPCPPGASGRLICTGFGNPLFPLIRYDVGDRVRLSTRTTCPCGIGGVLVDEIEGRVEDFVFTPDGRAIGRLDHLLKDTRHIVEAQIVQDRLDHLTIRIVSEAPRDPDDEQTILAEARQRLGGSMIIDFEYVPTLDRGPTGKKRFIVSKLPPDDRRHLPAAGPLAEQ